MKNILTRCVRRICKQGFKKKFLYFDISSSVGADGVGKGCKLSGTEHISIGKDCFFGEGTELVALEHHFQQTLNSMLLIGDHVRCVGGCRITCAGNLIIENDVLIGPDVFITDRNHGMNPCVHGGYSKQTLIVKNVKIGNGVWLGQRVCVLPGVTVGAHSIVGANSVITHDIPPFSIAVGSPARVIKKWDPQNNQWVSAAKGQEIDK